MKRIVTALHRYQLIGTEAEISFESVARLVSEIFKAMITLLGSDYAYYRSATGIPGEVSPRGTAFARSRCYSLNHQRAQWQIWVETGPDEGSVFYFGLPLR